MALTLLGAVALFWPRRAAADIVVQEGIWMLSPEITVPIGARFTLSGATACDNTSRYCVDYPVLSFGFDVTRPSSPGARSINLAFAQAPLTGFAALALVTSRQSPALRWAALAVAWLAGGMFRWTPGGEGNVQDGGIETRSSLSFVLKSEVALHPFVSPQYLRVTPGVGVALARRGRTRDTRTPWGFICSAGAVASLAAEYGGRSGWQPGVWLSCLFPIME